MTILLTRGRCEIVVLPELGGCVDSVRVADRSLLARTDWADTALAAPELHGTATVTEWLARYTGGWQVLGPNAGTECTVDGVAHPFHGEASLNSFVVTRQTPDTASMRRVLVTAPLTVTRTIVARIDGVDVSDRLRHDGAERVEVMWTFHPALGSDLLAGPARIRTSASTYLADAPDARPISTSAPEFLDVAHLETGVGMGCLSGFDRRAWTSVEREDDPLCVVIAWDGARLPYQWLWRELNGTSGPPWFGRFRGVGVEPATTWPALGLAHAHAQQADLLTLEPDEEVTATVSLRAAANGRTVQDLLAELDADGWPRTNQRRLT